MKKIIVNIIFAILALIVLFGVIYESNAFGIDGWIQIDIAIMSCIIFGINSAKIVSYLDPEEDDF